MLQYPLHGPVRISTSTAAITKSPRTVNDLLLREVRKIASLEREMKSLVPVTLSTWLGGGIICSFFIILFVAVGMLPGVFYLSFC